jgi:hypothetical protein
MVASGSFYRYDSWTDGWQQLSSSPTTVTCTDTEFLQDQGVEGRVISATGTTVELCGFQPRGYEGYEIRITGGTGKGQRRVITSQAEAVVVDTGVATAVSVGDPLSVTDSTKNWVINQWAGYTVRIAYGQGLGQARKILYNDATTLVFGDTSFVGRDMYGYSHVMNLNVSATAGSQSIYSIESSVCTVDSTWATTPDATSRFKILTGAIMMMSGVQPFVNMYVIGEDNWYYRQQASTITSTSATELRIKATPETDFISVRSIATAGTTTTLTDSTANWNTDEWVGRWLFITSGTGEGQLRNISANTQTQLTWVTVGTAPTTTSRYTIEAMDAGTATAGSATTLTDSTQAWTVDKWKNQMVYIVSGTGLGQFALIASNTATALTLVKSWTSPSWYLAAGVAPDATSVYFIAPDSSAVYVTAPPNAAIHRQSLQHGIWYLGNKTDDGIAMAACARYADFAPVAIASTTGTTTQTVTTVNPHGFKTGWTILHAGDTGASAVANNISAVVTVLTATTYTYPAPGSVAAWTVVSGQSTTTLKDCTKNWTVNEHAGKIVRFGQGVLTTAGVQLQLGMEIASNTATTLTFKGTAANSPAVGRTSYVICSRNALGGIQNGICTGTQTTTTIVDTDKNTTYTGSVTGTVLTVTVATIAGLQVGNVVTGTGITAGSIIMSLGTGTGGTGTYNLSASSAATGSITVTSGWVVNSFVGRRVKIIAGNAGPAEGTEHLITANGINSLTFAATTLPVAGANAYVILGQVPRGAGSNLDFAATPSRQEMWGRYLFSARGGAVQGFDRFDIVTNQVYSLHNGTLHSQLWSTGTNSAYDCNNRIYMLLNGGTQLFYLDIVTGILYASSTVPYIAGSAVVSNRMMIIETADRLKYLYVNRPSNVEMYRKLLFL